jgi:hypothetical protein
MRQFWQFSSWLPYDVSGDTFGAHCDVVNRVEISHARRSSGKWLPDHGPVWELRLTLDSFDIDCFGFDTCTLVSERMREAMNLDPSGVRFLDVDLSRSAPLPRSKKYQLMDITAVENVSDPSRSVFEMKRFCPESPLVPFRVESIAVRNDARPEHELFLDQFFRAALCSDALAMRVLKAGCTGVRFMDPSVMWKVAGGHFRTLRGIEQDAYDAATGLYSTKVVGGLN